MIVPKINFKACRATSYTYKIIIVKSNNNIVLVFIASYCNSNSCIVNTKGGMHYKLRHMYNPLLTHFWM